MKVTVRKLLDLEVYKDTKLVAGLNGIENEAKGITIIEDNTIGKWLRGNEILITSLGFLKDSTEKEMVEFFETLSNNNISALIIKVGKYVDNVPAKLIEWGNYRNIPIIQAPVYKLYTDMMYPVMADIMNTQLNKLRYFKEVHNKFITMFISQSSTEGVICELSKIIDNPVVLTDSNFNKICASEDIPIKLTTENSRIIESEGVNIRYYEKIIEINNIAVTQKIIEIQSAINTKSYLHILEKNRKIEEMDFIAMESVCTNLVLKMLSDFTVKEVESKFMRDLLNDLALGNIENMKNLKERANIAGINLNASYIVLALNLSNKSDENILDLKKYFKIFLKKSKGKYCINSKNSMIILLEIVEEQNIKNKIRQIKQELNYIKIRIKEDYKNTRFNVGIGSLARNFKLISKSYTEAIDALELGSDVFGSDIIVSYDELGIYKLLRSLHNYDKELLKHNIPNSIITLIEYDNNKKLELFKTLEMYLKNDKHIKLTAQELFIHPKTVSYRIEKIKKIAQIDFNDIDEIIEIQLAFRILKFINKEV